MTPLMRVMKPAQERNSKPPRVHYESPNGQKLLCMQSDVYRTIDGERMRIWFRTKRPVTCASCTKLLEIRTRKELRGLNGDQLEDIQAHIATFRSRYLAPPESNHAPDGKS